MMRHSLAAAAVILSLAAGRALAGTDYSAIYSFGDSLSDVGNAYIYTSIPGNGPVQPAPPYFSGEFSNGPIWLQDLAPMLGLPLMTPSFLPYNGNDYAIGDASTGSTPIYTAQAGLDLPSQIQAFEIAHLDKAPSSALYTFSIGANDVFGLLAVLATDPTFAGTEAVLEQAALNVASAAGELEKDGAKRLLIYNVPDLGLTPYIQDLAILHGDPSLPGQAATLSNDFNALVSQDLAADDPGLDVFTLDAYDLIQNAVKHPADYGLTNVTDPCWTGGTTGYAGGGTVCSSPGTYLFWDFAHPTATANEFVAEAAYRALVPEPSTWGMMLIGLAALGFAGARRARATAAATDA
jgi:phospholipase/lecithinase/hemolysin